MCLLAWWGWLAGGPCIGKGVGGHFPTKSKQMWLETPAAQGPAQGPRKFPGAKSRQGGIQDENFSAAFVDL